MESKLIPLYFILGLAILYASGLYAALFHTDLKRKAARKIDKWNIDPFTYILYHNNTWCMERMSKLNCITDNKCHVCKLIVPNYLITQWKLLNGK